MPNRQRYDYFGGVPSKNNVVEELVALPLVELTKYTGTFVDAEIFLNESKLIAVTNEGFKKGVIHSDISIFSRDTLEFCWKFKVVDEYSPLCGGGVCLFNDIVIAELRKARSIIGLRDGEKIWETSGINIARVIGYIEEEIMFAAFDGIYILSPFDGKVLRRYEMNRANSSTFNEEVIIAYSQSDDVLNCFDRRSGKLLWCTNFAEVEKAKGTVLGSVACRSPIIVGDRLYTAVGSGTRIACFDLNKGELLWKNDAVYLNAILYRNGRLHGTQTNGYYCLDAATGEVIHKITCSDAIYGDSLPYMAGKYLFCTGKRLVAIDTDTCEEVWVIEDKRKTHYFMGQPIFLDGRLYTADNKGNLYCFGNA